MPSEDTPDGGKTPPLAARDERPLRESLDDASVLLWYATREGKTLPDGTVKTIVDAQHRLAGGARDPAVESAFWLAFRNLAMAVHPISVDSILATYSYPFGIRKERRPFADAAVTKRKYSVAAVLVLVLLIVAQIYWFVGDTLRRDLESHRTELDKVSGSFRQMRFQAASVIATIRDKESQRRDAVAGLDQKLFDPGTVGNAMSTVETLTAEIDRLKGSQSQNWVDCENLNHWSQRVQIMLVGSERLLDWWDVFTSYSGVAMGLETARAAGAANGPDGDSTGGPVATVVFSCAAEESTAGSGAAGFDERLKDGETRLVTEQLGIEMSLQTSKSVLAIFNQYLLPLLYGLLGSLAYILRTLSNEIQNVTFTRASDIRYSLRWPLGMLGGVTVGLFFDPTTLTGIAAVTPLGLAFLAGYGVELLFTGLDRLVRAFASEEPARPKPGAA